MERRKASAQESGTFSTFCASTPWFCIYAVVATHEFWHRLIYYPWGLSRPFTGAKQKIAYRQSSHSFSKSHTWSINSILHSYFPRILRGRLLSWSGKKYIQQSVLILGHHFSSPLTCFEAVGWKTCFLVSAWNFSSPASRINLPSPLHHFQQEKPLSSYQ